MSDNHTYCVKGKNYQSYYCASHYGVTCLACALSTLVIIKGWDMMHEKLAATVRHNNSWMAFPNKVQYYILSKAPHNFLAVQAIRQSVLMLCEQKSV